MAKAKLIFNHLECIIKDILMKDLPNLLMGLQYFLKDHTIEEMYQTLNLLEKAYILML